MEQETLSKQDLLQAIEQAYHDLVQTIDSFDEEQFNTIPFEGSLTPGQVADHLFLSVSGIPELAMGETAPTTGRKPDQYVKEIADIFLNFDIKMKSPEFILPSEGPHQKQTYVDGFIAVSVRMKNIVASQDLSLTCTIFEFPGTGPLTRWEWLWFGIVHTQRHTHQLKNIYQALAA